MSPLLLFLLMVAAPATTDPLHHEEFLPPVIDWSGASEELMLPADDPWSTAFERSGGTDSPDYAATREWFTRLVAASEDLAWLTLGESPEGREIFGVVASGEGAFTPAELRQSDRPVLFVQAGIHSGEIDGKDAGMMLLRDMTVRGTKADLLDRVNLVLVPIFSVDGHERRGEHNRINQRGPRVQGWRTNARNLNLNRDYAKAQTVEMQHMLRVLHEIDPELYVDVHVTDGADYAYDVTWGANGARGWSPAIAAWLSGGFHDAVDAELTRMGHVPGPLVFTVDQMDIRKGMYAFTAGPRFSNGYGDARHLPTILVENHSLKPYRQRVLGTYVFMEAGARALADDAAGLRAAIDADRRARPDEMHLAYRTTEPTETDFLAIGEAPYFSDISGDSVMAWTGEVMPVRIPVLGSIEPDRFVRRPAAYWIPAAWAELGELLALHGIGYERIEEPVTVRVEQLRLPDAAIAGEAYEGRARVAPGEPVAAPAELRFGPGALRVPTAQAGGTLAVLLLEPGSPDSFFQWGMMLEVLQRTEYFESYVMEPMARHMLETDPDLARTFREKIESDAEFAADPRARLRFFYDRTAYADDEWLLYPVAREMGD